MKKIIFLSLAFALLMNPASAKVVSSSSNGGLPPISCSTLTNAAASCSTDTTNAANISSGTLPAGRLPAFTGDNTSSAGSSALTAAATQANITSLSNASGVAIHGANNNTAAATGFVGELKVISRVASNALAVSSNTPTAVGTTTSITLTAGNWLISSSVGCLPVGGSTFTFCDIIINTSVGFPSSDTQGVPTNGIYWSLNSFINNPNEFVTVGQSYLVSVANGSTLQLFLVVRTTYLGGTGVSVFGNMWAMRVF